jgi:hypothetical protein
MIDKLFYMTILEIVGRLFLNQCHVSLASDIPPPRSYRLYCVVSFNCLNVRIQVLSSEVQIQILEQLHCSGRTGLHISHTGWNDDQIPA